MLPHSIVSKHKSRCCDILSSVLVPVLRLSVNRAPNDLSRPIKVFSEQYYAVFAYIVPYLRGSTHHLFVLLYLAVSHTYKRAAASQHLLYKTITIPPRVKYQDYTLHHLFNSDSLVKCFPSQTISILSDVSPGENMKVLGMYPH